VGGFGGCWVCRWVCCVGGRGWGGVTRWLGLGSRRVGGPHQVRPIHTSGLCVPMGEADQWHLFRNISSTYAGVWRGKRFRAGERSARGTAPTFVGRIARGMCATHRGSAPPTRPLLGGSYTVSDESSRRTGRTRGGPDGDTRPSRIPEFAPPPKESATSWWEQKDTEPHADPRSLPGASPHQATAARAPKP